MNPETLRLNVSTNSLINFARYMLTGVCLPLLMIQSCDSTQIDDSQLPKSPVFPLTSCTAQVHVPRLSQNLLETCRTSGFVLCSQDSCASSRRSPPVEPNSPTFPRSPGYLRSPESTTARPTSPLFSETEQADEIELQLTPEYFRSPVFGRDTDGCPSACKSQVRICSTTRHTSGFTFSSQESLTSSVRPASCRPRSPVFPRSTSLPNNLAPSESSAFPQSPVSLETDGGQDGQTEPCHGRPTSPVISRMLEREKIHSLGCSGRRSPSSHEEPSRRTRPVSWTTSPASVSTSRQFVNFLFSLFSVAGS